MSDNYDRRNNQILDINVSFGEAFGWFWRTTLAGLAVTAILGAILGIVIWLPLRIIEENSDQPSEEEKAIAAQHEENLRTLRALQALYESH